MMLFILPLKYPIYKPGKKEKKIIFVGKLNKAKGYDIFSKSYYQNS